MDSIHNTLKNVASKFALNGEFIDGEPYGSGHINDTYAVSIKQSDQTARYIFQRINHEIFKNPVALVENITRVTRHIHNKLEQDNTSDIDRCTLTLIPTIEGDNILIDTDGLYWRAYIFIENAKTYDIIESTDQAYQAARAFGQFQCQLADLPSPRLHETIPNFHHTRSRFDALLKAADIDCCERVASAQEELAFAKDHESVVDVLLDLQASGDLPERITHNDTKLNNVMIDDDTGEGICVIDLDTVMPGIALYDFGDMVRTATNTGAEDELDLSKISMDIGMFEALTLGYLSAAGSMLVPKEIEYLPFSGKLIALETGLRFLTDYLQGDVYFKTHRERHNLDRCRTQFKLVQSIEDQKKVMQQIVATTTDTLINN
ncbi:MAG TPA: mucin desulfatase [Verrucomicrobiales bacterium]|nr:mucin desulfatase [Verrucomicrobiales bacterium]HCI92535.1 mucin desulfatase [Verrucomicrobiales bacterium]HCL97423.1 mucin desulfatase [Verrucomicrobiales bacterium]